MTRGLREVGRSKVAIEDPEKELKVRGSASQRGRSAFVPDLRVLVELLSRKPRPGMSSWKVQGTFWGAVREGS